MDKHTKPAAREIIDDFAVEIERRKQPGPRPQKTVIDFRNERKDGIEREIYYVPVELLRYRKDNGRIASDVLHYEKLNGLLDERSAAAQKVIEKFLFEKDKEKTEELKLSLEHEGQREPAIITCDGFLINGNRRKMALCMMIEKTKDSKYSTMKVVILPGKNDPGGPPTLKEIEQIENRYQLQSDGKAEYYNFDRALSIKRKIDIGISLEEQLRDDSRYRGLDSKKFKKALEYYENEYLKPLECIDRYLESLGREKLYNTISTGYSDSEGRWQAFRDYYNSVYLKLTDKTQLVRLGINEHEIGKIEDACFKIIRKREFPGELPKAHMIIRQIPKILANPEAKKELMKVSGVDISPSKEKLINKEGIPNTLRDIDKMWGQEKGSVIINQVKKALNLHTQKKERETPVALLEAALKKLNHDDMDTSSLSISDLERAMKIARQIKERAAEVESELYRYQKNLPKLAEKFKRNK
ncbi:MAG: hypothetical protein IBX72_10525 [Nitrospirae bacterium]|nr:hypothetical protein [Nitrospirota bacterium]